ncbi:MAG: membrane protein insertion efficiency factor YidD [Deltaproteobacteria bacterium]|jgi:putative membrane protein insertion efficiency factor|nr:membrane protein insertion efficiency factor YidD [Deltaproteobacteria bacterium]
MRRLVVLPVRIYQWCISPLLPPACRFYPSCSNYILQAVLHHGILCGGQLGLRRLARCHPWSPGGYDPVPPALAPRLTGVQE